MNKNEVPLNKEGCHWGGSISRSKANNLSITVDVGTDKMHLKLRAIAKHCEALADELDAIDNAWQCDCGCTDYQEDITHDYKDDAHYIKRTCTSCGTDYTMPLDDDLPTRLEGSD